MVRTLIQEDSNSSASVLLETKISQNAVLVQVKPEPLLVFQFIPQTTKSHCFS